MAAIGRITRREAICVVAAAIGAGKLGARIGEPAPHFAAKTLDGERFTSDSLKGKVVLIEFWATWCPYCKKDEPLIESLIRDFSKDGLIVLAVDMGEPRRKVKKYLESSPRTAKIVLADDTTLAAICDAKAYPLYVLIDRDGNIAGRQNGSGGERALRHLLSRAGLES